MEGNNQPNSQPAKKSITETFNVSIRNRDGVLFEGGVKWLTSFNSKGKFDILPGHASFISIINKTVEFIKPDGVKQSIEVDNAVLEYEDNDCKIFLGVKKQTS